MFAISLAAILVGGCHRGAPLDENDASHAQVLRKNLHGTSESANQQVATGEISRSEGERITREKAAELAKKVPPDDIEGPDSWKYGEMFLAAHDWFELSGPYVMR